LLSTIIKINQNIIDTLKATIVVISLVLLAVTGVQLYIVLTTDTESDISYFLKLAEDLHGDIDAEFLKENVTELAGIISSPNLGESKPIALAISHGIFMTNAYRERFYDLMSVTDATLVLKNALIQEGGLFLNSYHNLREALNDSLNEDYDSRDSNIHKVLSKLDEALALRYPNTAAIERWLGEPGKPD
jgi:hypothetical protein